MKTIRYTCLLLLLCTLICVPVFAGEGEILYSEEYCFSPEELAPESGGIFVSAVPDSSVATVKLGNRSIRPGDVLASESLERLSLVPGCRENCEAVLCYLPIYGNRLGEEQRFVIRIRSGKNEAPKAEDMEMETYKNIANNGKLRAVDPEGAKTEFYLAEPPKLGKAEVKADGSFLYIPGKNKVGEDSFTFIAKDEAGNESKAATVKIRIRKPNEAMSFADMEGNPSCFEAMWACQGKLIGGMEIAGRNCFCPDKSVSRAEFLVMAMELTGQEVDEKLRTSGFVDGEEAPSWVRPYLAQAMRSGIVRGEVGEEGMVFRPNDPITGREAAVILQNILRLPVSASVGDSTEPRWAASSVQALSEAGMVIESRETLTREGAVCLLYAVSCL